MTPDDFIRKWKASTLTERSASQSHFLDLCALLGEPTPTDSDPTGATYTFEKGAMKTTVGQAGPTCGSAAASPGNTRASTRT